MLVQFQSWEPTKGTFQMPLHNRLVYLFEPNSYEVFLIHVSTDELMLLDDQENYVIVDPDTKQTYNDGEWKDIPIGRIQPGNQIVVTSNNG